MSYRSASRCHGSHRLTRQILFARPCADSPYSLARSCDCSPSSPSLLLATASGCVGERPPAAHQRRYTFKALAIRTRSTWRKHDVRPPDQPRRLLVPLGLRAEHRLQRQLRSEVRGRHGRHDLRDDLQRAAGQPRRRLQLHDRDRPSLLTPGDPASDRRHLDRRARHRPDGRGLDRDRRQRQAERRLSLDRQRRDVRVAQQALADDLVEERSRSAPATAQRGSTSTGYQVAGACCRMAAKMPPTAHFELHTDDDGAHWIEGRRSPDVQLRHRRR